MGEEGIKYSISQSKASSEVQKTDSFSAYEYRKGGNGKMTTATVPLWVSHVK